MPFYPFLAEVSLLKKTTEKGYPYSNLSTGGPSFDCPKIDSNPGVLLVGPWVEVSLGLIKKWSPAPNLYTHVFLFGVSMS